MLKATWVEIAAYSADIRRKITRPIGQFLGNFRNVDITDLTLRFEPYEVETQMSHSLTDIIMQFPSYASTFAFLGVNQAGRAIQ